MSLGIDVRFLAERIIEDNPNLYNQEFLVLIPEEILNTKLSDENLIPTSELIDDKLLFPKSDQMAALLGLPENWVELPEQKNKLIEAVNNPSTEIAPEQEKVGKEIRFLFTLAVTVAHQ
jgi:hypothetical protein